MKNTLQMQESELKDHAIQESANAVLRGTELADLALIYDPSVMLASAPMPPSPAAFVHAEALAEAGPRSSTVRVRTPDGVPEASALQRLTVKDAEGAEAWISYLIEVTEPFADLFGARVVGIRQIVADGPHCSRFHVDRVLARGVLNVLGACTEWLDDPDLDRTRMGHAGGSEDETSGLVRRWEALRRLQPGELAVFKGTAWPGAEERAIVHRSPPANGHRRLMLTLDCLE